MMTSRPSSELCIKPQCECIFLRTKTTITLQDADKVAQSTECSYQLQRLIEDPCSLR